MPDAPDALRAESVSRWKDSFTPAGPEMVALGLTIPKPHQGELGWAQFLAGRYPACSKHGAMNKVAPAPLWRCLNCNIGAEVVR